MGDGDLSTGGDTEAYIGRCKNAFCDRCGTKGPLRPFCRSEDGNCIYSPDMHSMEVCPGFPLKWGTYCAYEESFIIDRYGQLLDLFGDIQDYYKTLPATIPLDAALVGDIRLNSRVLYMICCLYANDLKPVRKFHDIKGGCDKARRAAFIARLIAMHRPVVVPDWGVDQRGSVSGHAQVDGSPFRHHPVMKINEWFALQSFYYYLNLSPNFFLMPSNFDFLVKIQADILYVLSHRDPQIELLVTVGRLIQRLAGSDGEKHTGSVTHG